MSIYEIVMLKSAALEYAENKTAPGFSTINTAMVTAFPWNCAYQPVTTAQAAALEDAFIVRMRTDETDPRTEVKELNGPVYTDSCMEFFFMPDPEHSKKYINWEFNSAGVLFISIGTDRYDRRNLEPENYARLFRVEAKTEKNGWEVSYIIPYEFLRKFFPGFQVREGGKMRGNFHKCADKADKPHYGCWAPIDLPDPDFHCPDFFGELILARDG